MRWWRYGIAIIGGFAATISRQYALIFICVIVAIVFDVITGLIKSKVTGRPWNSKQGTIGFWKKIALLVALAFGIFLDYFIPIALSTVSIVLPFATPFGLMIGVYITLNESISICENLYEINPLALPKWIVKLLKSTSEKINDKEENDNDNERH